MKNIKFAFIGLVLAAAPLTGCQDSYDAPELQTPEATLVANTTLAEFKEFILNSITETGSNAILVPEKENGEHYVIHGRVVSCDASGNIYQNLCIQDETSAITFSVREGNMWSQFRIGQDVVFDATGIYAGSYNGLYQLGWLDEYNGAPSLTFMSWLMFKSHVQLNGLPNDAFKYVSQNASLTGEWPADYPYCIVYNSIGDITSLSPTALNSSTVVGGLTVMSQLVEIQNVQFTDGGKEPFAPYQESVNRTITDAQGNSIIVRTSGYSNFYSLMLPEGTGTVRGILSYYGSDWQLLLRGIDDVMFDDMPGYTQESALTVADAIAQENSGRTLWTKGYIVGSVKAEISKVTSNDDIIFGPNAELPTNVVIADSPEVTEYSQCMVVELRNGSAIRKYVNLVDNPECYGKLLYVAGSLSEVMGISGIQGADTDFDISGVVIGGDDGVGNENSPFSVNYIIENHPDFNGSWVTGYIVGYVNGSDFNKDAVFNADVAGMTNYSNANVIISSSPTGATVANSIPVRTLDRNAQGLKANPSNLGKKVKIQGTTGTYLNGFGLEQTAVWIFE